VKLHGHSALQYRCCPCTVAFGDVKRFCTVFVYSRQTGLWTAPRWSDLWRCL